MRRRFGRMRRGSAGTAPAVDADRLRSQLAAAERFSGCEFEAAEADPEEATLAALAWARDPEGRRLLVSVAPAEGADAVLVAASAIRRLEAASEELPQTVLAAAPRFDARARRRLGCFAALPAPLVAVELRPGEGAEPVPPEPPPAPPVASPEDVALGLGRPVDRALFDRARRALEGLAAKHGGVVRAAADRVELVLLARRVAALRADGGGAVLDLHTDRKENLRLSEAGLAEALDRLEGFLRKRLNDRKVREGEDGFRATLLPRLAEAGGLRDLRPWPVPGPEGEILDLVAVGDEGAPVAAVVRIRLGLAELGAALDAAVSLPPALPLLLREAEPPRRLELPALLLAGRELSPAVLRVVPALAIRTRLFRVDAAGELAAVEGREPVAGPEEVAAPVEAATPAGEVEGASPESEGREAGSGGRSRRRRRRGRGRAGSAGEAAAGEAEAEGEAAAPPRFEVLTAFDLKEDDAEPRAGRRRRRGRGRGRRDASASGPSAGSDEDDEASEPASAALADAGDEDDLELALPDEDVAFEELAEQEEELSLAERLQLERELRRRARIAKLVPEPEPEEEAAAAARPRPRRRAALAVHADRDSLAAAVLLARDLRLVEGIWVYPQSELMTFFRGPAIDLREDAALCVLGFRPSPLHDALQAASLYAGRIEWYDHHAWPPEDVDAMQRAIGAEALHLAPGVGSLLPAVVEGATRRSRFSDKFLDLVTGRFTQHDFERWGRLWWHRLGEIASESGDVKGRLEPLLAGRPSDLAREAAAAPLPPPPPEASYVAGRDFRVVHFGGHALVVVPVPAGLDVHLAARIARERYGADLSLGLEEEEERAVLADQGAAGGRGFDLAAMVAHLDAKHGYVTALPGADHVARFRIAGLRAHPERLDEVLTEIALGRSILEG